MPQELVEALQLVTNRISAQMSFMEQPSPDTERGSSSCSSPNSIVVITT